MSKAKDRVIIFNKFGGKCAYCGCELLKGWHVDHVESVERISRYDKDKRKFIYTGKMHRPENDHMDNLNPSCASCNIQKSGANIEQFRRNISQFVHSLNTYSTPYKFARRYALISETNIEVKFYFETFNTSPSNG